MEKPRLGHINFLNVLPLTYSLEHDNYKDGVTIVNGVPAVINNDLLTGRLDAAEVSSIVYARHSEKLRILPDVCVRSNSEVQSIILVSRKPIYELNEDKIILTAKSATSHVLLKIIMHYAYDANPTYYIRNVTPSELVPSDAAAALFIGDDALYINHHRKKYDYYYYDLGREWNELTGLAMVYAVWVVNSDFADGNPEAVKHLYDIVYRGIRHGYKKKHEIITQAIEEHPFTYEQLNTYLERIRWNLTDEYLEGLETFYRMAYDMRLIKNKVKIKFADVF